MLLFACSQRSISTCFHSQAPASLSASKGSPCARKAPLRRKLTFPSQRRAGCRQAARASTQTAVELPEPLHKIVKLFKLVPAPKLKYQQLLAYAKELPLLPADLHTEDHKVRGCVSQVWVVGELDSGGRLTWRADSDSALTKGLAALLVQGLTGCPPETVIKMDSEWISQMGLQQSLTPSRNNGFLNMFKLMQQKSLELLMTRDRTAEAGAGAGPVPSDGPTTTASAGTFPAEAAQPAASMSAKNAEPLTSHNGHPSGAASSSYCSNSSSRSSTAVRDNMHTKIEASLRPSM